MKKLFPQLKAEASIGNILLKEKVERPHRPKKLRMYLLADSVGEKLSKENMKRNEQYDLLSPYSDISEML